MYICTLSGSSSEHNTIFGNIMLNNDSNMCAVCKLVHFDGNRCNSYDKSLKHFARNESLFKVNMAKYLKSKRKSEILSKPVEYIKLSFPTF